MLGTPASAQANGRVIRLFHAHCPAPYAVTNRDERFTPREVRRAVHDHRFQVHVVVRRLVPPVNWLQNPYHSQAFQSRLANLGWLDVLFYAHRKRGGSRALVEARDLVLDWIHHQRPGQHGTSPEAWQGKAAGDRAPQIAYLLRAGVCEGVASHHQARTILNSLAVHARVLEDPGKYRFTNHGLSEDLGLLRMARLLRFLGPADHWRRLAKSRFKRNFGRNIIEREGFWEEHSAGYQVHVMTLLQQFVDLTGDHSYRRLLRRMKDVAGWLTEPDHRLVQIGDSAAMHAPAEIQRRAERDRGMLRLLRSGLVVAKEPGAFLSTQATFFSHAHKHSDELSFDLFDRGHRIVSDTGLYDKDSGRYYRFARSARAHSTLTVDGRGFPRDDRHAYGSALDAAGYGDGWFATLGHNPLLPGGVRHRRLLLYRPHVAVIVVDAVRAQYRHRYDRYIQLGPEVQIDGRGRRTLTLSAPGFSGRLFSESSRGPERRSERRGQTDPLAGFVFPGFRERDPRWTVRYRTRGRAADFATTLTLDGSDLRAEVEHAGARVTGVRLTEHGQRVARLQVHKHGRRLRIREVGSP